VVVKDWLPATNLWLPMAWLLATNRWSPKAADLRDCRIDRGEGGVYSNGFVIGIPAVIKREFKRGMKRKSNVRCAPPLNPIHVSVSRFGVQDRSPIPPAALPSFDIHPLTAVCRGLWRISSISSPSHVNYASAHSEIGLPLVSVDQSIKTDGGETGLSSLTTSYAILGRDVATNMCIPLQAAGAA
jgi:hypothetical protein